MDLTSLKPEVLRELAKLAEQKAALVKQISEIDNKINAVAKGLPPAKSKAVAATKAARGSAAAKKTETKAKSGRRGQLKEQILALLEKAGTAGMAVKEISKTLGVKNQNIHVWFSTTGKKVEGVTKLDGAKYAWLPTATQHQQPEA